MPIVQGKAPVAWKNGSGINPATTFSFLYGGGTAGGGAPVEFSAQRTKKRNEEKELEKQRKQALNDEPLTEMTDEEFLNSDAEFGPTTWAAEQVDYDAIAQSMVDSGQLSVGVVNAEYINADKLSAISSDMGEITAGTITGATIQTATSGARFVLTSTTMQGINSSGDVIFEVLIDGANVGDVIMGDDATGKYAKWDDSAGTFTVQGDTVDADTLQIAGNDISPLLNSFQGLDNLQFISVQDMNADDNGSSSGVVAYNNGFDFTGAGGSADDGMYMFVGDLSTEAIADKYMLGFDMSSYFEVQTDIQLIEQGGWGAGQNGSFIWVGFANIYPTTLNSKSDLAVVDHAGLMWEYQDGTGWTLYLKTGDGTTTTETDLGVVHDPTSSNRLCKVVSDGTTVTFYIDGTSVGTITTNLPDATNPTYACLAKTWSESAGSSRSHDSQMSSVYAIVTRGDLNP